MDADGKMSPEAMAAKIAELEARNRVLEKQNTRGHAVLKLFEVTARETRIISVSLTKHCCVDLQVPATEVEVNSSNFVARGTVPFHCFLSAK